MARKKKKRQIRLQDLWKYFGDGIWEIALGIAVVWGGIITWQQWLILWLIPIISLVLMVYLLKRSLVFPRAKAIKFKTIMHRKTIGLIVLVFIVIFGLLSILKKEPGLAGYWSYLQQNALIMSAIITAVISFFIAFITHSPQFYLHGFLLFMTFFMDASIFAEKPLGLAIGAGIVMLVSGVVNLKRFLQLPKK